jgi:hypothetical protein
MSCCFLMTPAATGKERSKRENCISADRMAIPVVASAVGHQKTAGFPIAALAYVAPPLKDAVYGKPRDRRR